MSLEILLSGATGSVGQHIIALSESDEHIHIAGRASRRQMFEPDADADVVVDFSHPELLGPVLDFAVRRRLPLVTGTTGLDDRLQGRVEAAAQVIPVCQAANFSLGVHLLLKLVAEASASLGRGYDAEISEIHHRRKIDAPSGTALALGAAIERGRGRPGRRVDDRSQTRKPRGNDDIGYQAVRGGDVVGEHTGYVLGQGERIELSHRATDRSLFARGALAAARRIIDSGPGVIDFSKLVLSASH